MPNICDNCIKLEDVMRHGSYDPFGSTEKVYDFMYDMYKKGELSIYFADCSVDNFFEELSKEEHYTYSIYTRCKKCKRIFLFSVCTRGTPAYKVVEEPDIEQLKRVAQLDKKTIYCEE